MYVPLLTYKLFARGYSGAKYDKLSNINTHTLQIYKKMANLYNFMLEPIKGKSRCAIMNGAYTSDIVEQIG